MMTRVQTQEKVDFIDSIRKKCATNRGLKSSVSVCIGSQEIDTSFEITRSREVTLLSFTKPSLLITAEA